MHDLVSDKKYEKHTSMPRHSHTESVATKCPEKAQVGNGGPNPHQPEFVPKRNQNQDSWWYRLLHKPLTADCVINQES